MDNDPAAMEKKIEAAASHGVNVMLFDWYWYENKPFLESALNDGFLKARNVDKMTFYLMWANHDAKTVWDIRRSHKLEVIWPGSVDLPTFKTVVARVINKYFSHRCYYTIDGKPVFAIYDMNNLIKGLGGIQQTVAALDYFRSEVKKAGFPALHLQMIYWAKVPKIDDSGFASAFLEEQRRASDSVDVHAVGEGEAVQGDPYSFLSKAKVDKKIIPDRLPGHLLFKENIVYTPGTDTKLRDLDILYHIDHKTVKRPAILVIHGGGWRGGDKIRGHEIMAIYALQGYVTVSVNYRLSPDSVAPAHVHDVKLSIRWLRANAEKYGIDPDRIGCTGGSAGGHLSAMVAVTQPSDDLEGPFLSEYSSAVQAAVPLSGVFDLRGSEERFIDPFLGGPFGCRKPGLSKKMSPTWLLTPERARTIPPMLVVHSDNEMVPVVQVEGFMDGLKKIGRNDPLVLLPGKVHGHRLIQVTAVREAADKFFREHLNPQPPGSKK